MRPIEAQYHYRHFLYPKYWPTWMVIFLMYLISFLPYKGKLKLGEWLGRRFYQFGGKRRRTAESNIRVCFPELSADQQQAMVRATFISNAIGYIENTIAWWRPLGPYLEKLQVHGLEHLTDAQRRGKGILLVGGHFSIMDFAGPLLHDVTCLNYMYRPQNNALFNALVERSRRHYSGASFDKRQLKEMLEFIKQGNTVWYGPDQDLGLKQGVFAPFFGILAASLTTPAWIARETGATVLQISQFREQEGIYSIYFSPILENFPESDEVANATRINAGLATAIRRHPEQYLWLHRRFKTRPEGSPSIY